MQKNLRVLKKYGFLIEDSEGRTDELSRIPNRNGRETFRQWKIRTFGEDVPGMTIYRPFEPGPQTQMSTLERDCGAGYLLHSFKMYRQLSEVDAQSAIDDAVNEEVKAVTKRLTTIPKELLEETMEQIQEQLEPSVQEFLNRYLDSTDKNIQTKEILLNLLKNYNSVVASFRRLSERE